MYILSSDVLLEKQVTYFIILFVIFHCFIKNVQCTFPGLAWLITYWNRFSARLKWTNLYIDISYTTGAP